MAEDALVVSTSPTHPANLIPELCQLFYRLGTGGGMSIADDDGHIYIAPSGVSKERMKALDLFVMNRATTEYLRRPPSPLKPSACTPLFLAAYTQRSAMACIHTHSQHAVMVTLLWPGREFRIKDQEMIKGIRRGATRASLSYHDELVVPIIENTPLEEDLRESLEQAILAYPDTCAVLVRRHGVYVWGESWEKTKTQAECYDYLFELAVRMRGHGIPCV